MPKIDIYGWGGVNTTKNPLQLENNELTKAQNAFRDSAGDHGSLRKRLGLTKVNSVALSGSVYGFINVPLPLITIRQFFIGIDQAVTTAYQWLRSIDAMGAVATATTPAATSKGNNHAYPVLNGKYVLTHRGIQIENSILYPGEYTRGASQPIRIYNGSVDREYFKVPLNPRAVAERGLTAYAAHEGQLLDWCLVGRKLYFISLDYIHVGTALYSTIFEYDFDTSSLVQIGEGCGSGNGELGDGGVIFSSLTYHQGYLYAGAGSFGIGTNSTAAGVYSIRPGVDTTWTYDFDNSGAGDTDHETPISMASYKGLLYVGMHDSNTSTAHLRVRSAAGAYTSSTSLGNGNGSCWPRMLVFGDNLYACGWDNNGASSITTIRKFDGSSWSTVKTLSTGVANPFVGVEMLIHNGVLYVLAVNQDRDAMVSYSANGTSWTDQTSGMTNDNVLSIFGVFTD